MDKTALHTLAEKASVLASDVDAVGDLRHHPALRADIYEAADMIMKAHDKLSQIAHDFDHYGVDYSLDAVLQRVSNGTSGAEDAAVLRRLTGTHS